MNGKGFSSMIKGLNGDCQYTMVIMANNGYVTSITTKDYHTTGVYNPGMDTYDYEDFLEQQPSKEELIKDWNYYAMDLTVEDETLTRYARGTVSIRQSTETKYDFDIEALQVSSSKREEFGKEVTFLKSRNCPNIRVRSF